MCRDLAYLEDQKFMTERPIYAYEVRLRVTHRDTCMVEEIVVVEHAYSVMDACMQSLMNASVDRPNCDAAFLHVGPPLAAIARAESSLADAIGELARTLREPTPPTPKMAKP